MEGMGGGGGGGGAQKGMHAYSSGGSRPSAKEGARLIDYEC